MKLFNAVQLVVLFAIMPFINAWLFTGPFDYSMGVFILGIIANVGLFLWLVFIVYDHFTRE